MLRFLLGRLGQIAGHGGIIMPVGPEAFAMVAHVDGDDAAAVGQTAGDGAPVARRTEEAMHDQ